MNTSERALQWLLRIIGGSSLLAVIAVVMPYTWMNAIHQWLGLGVLPDAPIVGYLARSTSAFYALLGGLLWVVSFDLRRHRLVLRYLGAACFLFGAALFAIDLAEGLPKFWTFWEGPFSAAFGLAVFWLSGRVEQ
ncbi:MAG: hypothetical protein HZA90_15105 [Verrucomicrobia bacterium]|nr:hypothetical protein [Verrucomicrobiota bacterium]